MNKKTVWIIIGIVVVLAIILIATTGNNEKEQQPSTTLPEVSQADYNTLQTSDNDFAALDEALNQLG